MDKHRSMCYNPLRKVLPDHGRRLALLILGGTKPSFSLRRGGMRMYITLADLLQYSLVVIGIVGLFLAIKKK